MYGSFLVERKMIHVDLELMAKRRSDSSSDKDWDFECFFPLDG